jgi:hypothetical protein
MSVHMEPTAFLTTLREQSDFVFTRRQSPPTAALRAVVGRNGPDHPLARHQRTVQIDRVQAAEYLAHSLFPERQAHDARHDARAIRKTEYEAVCTWRHPDLQSEVRGGRSGLGLMCRVHGLNSEIELVHLATTGLECEGASEDGRGKKEWA